MLRHVLSIQQFQDKALLDKLFAEATKFAEMPANKYPKLLEHKILATIFFEPSTRTRLSFESAIQRLGGKLITVESAGEFSSAKKGESIEDTTRMLNAYADGIVMRHSEIGAADRAAKVSEVPVINGGDGGGEHPTQALLDIYTLQKAKGRIDGLKVAFVGDQLHNRTQRSFIYLLSKFDVELFLISPPELQLSQEQQGYLKDQGTKFHKLTSWKDILGELDAIYINRIEKERFATAEEYEALKDSYCITSGITKQMKKDAVILHPLPRLSEIAVEVDADARAIYFEQAKNGLFMRMALLQHIYAA